LIQKFTDMGSATERWHLAIFVNEWCEGGKLTDYLSRVDYLKVPGRQMQMWCQQACAGLKAIHELGICHRNLNPGNVYLDSSGKAKIGGFAAFKFPRGPGCGFSYGRTDVGTPAIIAPEVDDGYEVTTKADMWAFGCCMYYWCTGTLPDLRITGVENALKNVSLHFGERIRGAIRMCLQVHPDVRNNAEEVWMYLSVVDAMQKKKKRAMGRLRGMIGAKQGIGHGNKGKLMGVVDMAQQNKLKLKLLVDKAKAGGGD
jgi:serine/threonine protein kinase